MSLRVWLPLTKDLRQQGLSNIKVENHNATLNTAGKLGSCYYFNGSQQWLQFDTVLGDYYNNNWSIACWLKPTDSTRSVIISEYSSTGASNVGLELTASRVVRLYWNGSPDINFTTAGALPINEWTHLTVTKQARVVKVYFNGELKQTYTNSSDFSTRTSASCPRIGDDYRGNSANTVSYQGYINDFRMYDHCLSPMEVKELAKGLILHYPLDRQGWGQENLITQAMISADPWKSAISGTYTIDGKTGWILANNILYSKSGSGANNIFSGLTYETNTQYTISFKWRDDYRTDGKSSSLYIRFKYSDGTYSQVISSKDYNYWKEEIMTSTAGKTVSAITTTYGNGGNLLFTDLKLEKGAIKTPTSPIVNSDLYNSMGLNSATEYDCSGFCNNGEYYAYDANGSISHISDTPKYSVSTHIASANPTQNAASGTRYLYGHCSLTNPTQMSVAFWCKPISVGYGGGSTAGNGIFCTTNYEYGSSNVGSDYQSSAMNHRDCAVNMNDSASTTQCNVTFYPTIGEWHHYVYTYDGQVGRGYKDGVQTATKQFSAAKTLDSFIGVVIGFSKADGVWRKNDAYYSDFRIYATALSTDDVKSLYQNSAYIDNSGNIYGAVHTEV